MGGIRSFQKNDLRDVAQLWARAFHLRDSLTPQALSAYFDDVFFSSPWYTKELPSLLYEDAGGQIAGFLGVLPRVMRFMGQPIQVAVASQLMVDRTKPCAFQAIEMLRRFFAGPQDLSFSDGANGLARKLWEAAGGHVAMLYSPIWTRILRPAQYVISRCEDRKVLTAAAKMSRPICRALDATAVRIPHAPYWLARPDGIEEDPSADEILSCLRQFCSGRALQPEYDSESFQWLLQKASEQKKHGQFRKAIVRDSKGETCGWYIHYVRPGGVSQVLQVGGKMRSIGQVLSHLFYHAWRQGAVAVSGQLEPKLALQLAENHCGFTWSGGVLMHSRNSDLLNAIYRGDALFTRLEGEWWMRFCDLRESD